MRMRHLLRALVAAGAVLVTVTALPPVAHAATALSARTPLVSSTPTIYSFTTTLPYWTAVAVRPAAGGDYDLALYDSSGAYLTSSVWGGSSTDVIAINSNTGFRPLGSYLANVYRYSGSGAYSVMFWEAREVMPVPTDPVGSTATAIGLKFEWPVYAIEIYLRQNQGFRVNHGQDVAVYLAGSTPGYPSTYLRNRSALSTAYVIADNVPAPSGGVCRVFMAPAAGWYSMVLVWNTAYEPPPYDGGNAVFPQRYDPALGDTLTDCPDPIVP